MKIVLEQKAIAELLAAIAPVASKTSTIPILQCVLLDVGAMTLAMTATNLDMAVTGQIPAQVEKPGKLCVATDRFAPFVRALPAGAQVDLEASGGHLTVKCGRTRAKFATLPAEDFPVFAADDMRVAFDIPAVQLASLVERTRFAVSTDEARYYICGIFLHRDAGAGELTAVSTDGHRLAKAAVAGPEGSEAMPGIIVPSHALQLIAQLAVRAGGDVAVRMSETKLRLEFGAAPSRFVLATRLVEGTFPDYQRVIPAVSQTPVRVDHKALAEAVKRIQAAVEAESTKGKVRALKLAIESGTMTVVGKGSADETAEEIVDIGYDGSALDVGFNSRYLLELLAAIKGEAIEIHVANATSPAIVRDPMDATFLGVLMPMRV